MSDEINTNSMPPDPSTPSEQFSGELRQDLEDAARGNQALNAENQPDKLLIDEATLDDGNVSPVLLGAILDRENKIDELAKQGAAVNDQDQYYAAVERVKRIKARNSGQEQ